MTSLHSPPKLYQLSTVGALFERIYDSDTCCAELALHGNFGLGTFNHLDGEMVVLDGEFYQVSPDGSAHVVSAATKVAYATLAFFEPEKSRNAEPNCSLAQLQLQLNSITRSANMFYAIKIHGRFESVELRTVVCQQAPYISFTEVAKNQIEFECKDVTGTLIGFRAPGFASELTVAGYHFHFLDQKKSKGGHVLNALIREATIEIQELTALQLELPATDAFLKASITLTDETAVKAVENTRAAER